jgi:hypothetical protein
MPNDEKEQPASMHGAEEDFSDAVTCRLPKCKVLFVPKRTNQQFCVPAHREEFHTTARNVGTAALDALEKESEGSRCAETQAQREARIRADHDYDDCELAKNDGGCWVCKDMALERAEDIKE